MKTSPFRTLLGILLMLAGGAILVGAAVYAARSALVSYLAAHPAYLAAPTSAPPGGFARPVMAAPWPLADLPMGECCQVVEASPPTPATTPEALVMIPLVSNLDQPPEISPPTTDPAPLPTTEAAAELIDEPATPAEPAAEPIAEQAVEPTVEPTLGVETTPEEVEPPPEEEAVEKGVPPTSTPEIVELPPLEPTPLPPEAEVVPQQAAGPSAPVARLVIPSIKVKRAVMEIGLVDGPRGPQWDTDRLFATRNRLDLVGHLAGSAFPGEAGNTILVGHNYDYIGNGVFVNLQRVDEGDKIIVTTEDGLEYVYQVDKVKVVPYPGSASDQERHLRFLSPTPDERLTLVTCGGVRIEFFNKRVYVIAHRIE